MFSFLRRPAHAARSLHGIPQNYGHGAGRTSPDLGNGENQLLEERAAQHREEEVRFAEQRRSAIMAETDKLIELLESNTKLTREDKELSEQVAGLTREMHTLLARRERPEEQTVRA